MEKSEIISIIKKEKLVYIYACDYLSDLRNEYVRESEVNVAELKSGPHYVCKLLKSLNGKNHVEPRKNDKFSIIIYTSDITKSDKFFDLLVTSG